uniref:Uncharacterized protein n=1 Tax=Rhizophora mucronata TaxID=61149 RepID=A0A2P2P489_RHIMU
MNIFSTKFIESIPFLLLIYFLTKRTDMQRGPFSFFLGLFFNPKTPRSINLPT